MADSQPPYGNWLDSLDVSSMAISSGGLKVGSRSTVEEISASAPRALQSSRLSS
jgi:hypothetical protein